MTPPARPGSREGGTPSSRGTRGKEEESVRPRRRVAIVGSGISGLVSAFLLQRSGCYDVTIFEKETQPGGHALTLRAKQVVTAEVERGGRGAREEGEGDEEERGEPRGPNKGIKESEEEGEYVDLGFQVFNLSTYPHLSAFFDMLGVESEPSDMSFSLSIRSPSDRVVHRTGVEVDTEEKEANAPHLEWSSRFGLSSIFAQPSNALSPSFLSMLTEVRDRQKDRYILLRVEFIIGDYYYIFFPYNLTATVSPSNDSSLPQGCPLWTCRRRSS